MEQILRDDDLRRVATSLIQSPLAARTYTNYSSHLLGFFSFCDDNILDPLAVAHADIARYLAWLGQKDTVAAVSLHPYLSAINKFMQVHALPSVALGPLVAGVRKGLGICQTDTSPLSLRLPLMVPVAVAILELAEGLIT
jgi:hypothetical protein